MILVWVSAWREWLRIGIFRFVSDWIWGGVQWLQMLACIEEWDKEYRLDWDREASLEMVNIFKSFLNCVHLH